MRTREKFLLVLLTVTLAFGAFVYSRARRDEESIARFRSFVLTHPVRNISNAVTSAVEETSAGDNTAIFWYSGLSLFAIVALAIVFKFLGNAEVTAFKDRLVEARVAKAEVESLLQDSLWKEKNARAAREVALQELQESASTTIALEDRLAATERLLKKQEKELTALRSQPAAVTKRAPETPSARVAEQNALRDELQKMAGLLREKESAVKQLEKSFRDKMVGLETQLNANKKALGERDRELGRLRGQLAGAEAARRETETSLAQELRNQTQALEAKDAAMQEVEQGTSAKISNLETRLSDHLELLQCRNTELDAVRSELSLLTARLADVTRAKERADQLLQRELQKKAELLESKDAAFKKLQESAGARVQTLEGQLKNQEKVQKQQENELAALRAQLREVGAAKSHTETSFAKELRKHQQEWEAQDNALKRLEQSLATKSHALSVQLREKEELLHGQSAELEALTSKMNLVTAQLADVTSAKEGADQLLQQELKKKAELLESKDAAFRELQTTLGETVSQLENQITDKDALLQRRNTELGAATAQLARMELSQRAMDTRLGDEIRTLKEALQAKELGLRELDNGSTQLTAQLKQEISEQEVLLKRRDEELEALRSEIVALKTQPETARLTVAAAVAVHEAIEDQEAADSIEDSAKKLAALESSLRDKEDLLTTREDKITRLESELKEKRTELARHEISVWQAYERRALWKQRLSKFGISIKD